MPDRPEASAVAPPETTRTFADISAAEDQRAVAEEARVSGERMRRDAETDRTGAERSRGYMEALRRSAEDTRAVAEAARRDADLARREAEALRARFDDQLAIMREMQDALRSMERRLDAERTSG